MGLSTSQQFLVQAHRAAGSGDYFRWRAVGVAVGLSDAESDQAVRSLDARRLLVLLSEGEARLLAAGRDLARRLEAKSLAAAAPAGRGGRR